MLLVYASKTGNVQRFIDKLPYDHVMKIADGNEHVSEPFIFLTYTTGIGQVPDEVTLFCEKNAPNLLGVIASGNRNWGANYAIAADKISTSFGVPVLHKFELSGRSADVDTVMERIREYEIS